MEKEQERSRERAGIRRSPEIEEENLARPHRRSRRGSLPEGALRARALPSLAEEEAREREDKRKGERDREDRQEKMREGVER